MVTECDGGFPLLVFQLDVHLEPLAILFGAPHLDIKLFEVLVFISKIKEEELLTPFDRQDFEFHIPKIGDRDVEFYPKVICPHISFFHCLFALVQNVINHLLIGHFLPTKVGGAINRSEVAVLVMLINLGKWRPHFATVSLKLTAMSNILDDGAGQEGDGLGHFGSAQGAVGVGALVAGCTHQVAVDAAVHRHGGGHLEAHWAAHPLFQLVLQVLQGPVPLFQALALLLQLFISLRRVSYFRFKPPSDSSPSLSKSDILPIRPEDLYW